MLLSALQISGSSIGVYHDLFYGPGTPDSHLLVNKPRPIRSDEWLVNTQMTIAQANNGYQRINQNIGHGEDMSVILDVPYKGWSELFRPQNWSFFVLPLAVAFAFKWWIMGYLLAVSCYFFVLALLPGRRLLAAMLGLALLFSSFTQWWYQYITLAPMYYALFIATISMYLLRQKDLRRAGFLAAGLSYLLVCFALVLYPPFQIACGLALAAFLAGYLLHRLPSESRRSLLQKLAIMAAAALAAGIVIFAFLATRSDTVHTITNTVYPGKRVALSGGYDMAHLFSGHLAMQFQSDERAADYTMVHRSVTNQSETASFILLLPFLTLPALLLLWRDFRRDRTVDWPLLVVTGMFLLLVMRLAVPHFNWFYNNVFQLERVPQKRLVIAFGLLNIMQIVLLMRNMAARKRAAFGTSVVLLYALVVFAVELALGLYAMHRSPGFMGIYRCIAFALPVPVIVYLLLRTRYALALAGFLAFSLATTLGIHPLYRGVAILTDSQLSKSIRQIADRRDGKWIGESVYLENMPALNGAPSLSGVYTYPQLDIWEQIDHGSQQKIYNRYAHVVFALDRDRGQEIPTSLSLLGGDNFQVATEPCSDFLRKDDVRFIVTPAQISDKCVKLRKTVRYPVQNYYIYELDNK